MDRLAEDRGCVRTGWTTRTRDVGTTPRSACLAMMTRSVQEVGERLGYEAQDVLEALLQTVADAVYVVDKDGRVAFANPAALRLLGYDEHDLIGRVSHPTI